MARSMRPATPAGEDPQAVRHEFANHLRKLMDGKRWKATDLAVHAFGVDKNDRPKGRDVISKYLSGKSYPDRERMILLARAFKIPLAEMVPPQQRMQILAGKGDNVMVPDPNRPGFSILSLRRSLRLETCAKILTLVAEDEKQQRAKNDNDDDNDDDGHKDDAAKKWILAR